MSTFNENTVLENLKGISFKRFNLGMKESVKELKTKIQDYSMVMQSFLKKSDTELCDFPISRLEKKDQFFKKKALIKVINQKICEINDAIGDDTFRDEAYSEENCIFHYSNLQEFMENFSLNLKYKSISNKGVSLKFKTNMKEMLNQNYIQLLSDVCYLKFINYLEYEDTKLHIIKSGIHGDWPKAKCIHHEKKNSYIEMLQDYQPAHILFYPVNSEDVLEGHCAFGIYLIDEDNNFLCKKIIEIFDEKNAPADCKELRIPKRASELLRED
ncbi:hypothetical protein F946_01146 [Acinetobacter johnsonii ANC 3681]|uniref:Uncharacterized protein n=1 Tax=Acinetobacter johnsonii ANC 3681 TaxID=1217662 RepID=N9BJA2_ACIJO|nr:hypothetical protein [Acinetobacter johnsonii]ENV73256.1 hypothetical protein F946_01146 [Acinetobacter johnsonii ANC 3681]